MGFEAPGQQAQGWNSRNKICKDRCVHEPDIRTRLTEYVVTDWSKESLEQ
jgi:hypothetical protein